MMTQPFRFHVINNSKCFLNSQSGLNVSSKSKSYLNHDYTSTPSSKVKKITRCCTVLPVLRVINDSRWWRRPLTVSAGVNRQRGWCCHYSRLISLIKSPTVVTVKISKFGCYQQLIQDSFPVSHCSYLHSQSRKRWLTFLFLD